MIWRVFHWIDEHVDELTDFLVQFVGHRSDGGHELAVQRDFLYPWLEREMDWSAVELVNVCPEQERPFINAVWRGRAGGRSLLLNGHVDVAPVPEVARERWSFDPWEAFARAGHVYGRGSVDMKGGITAMLWALRALMATGVELDGDVLLSMVSGEETGEAAIGSVAAARRFREQGWEIPFAVVGEPSGLEIHTASAGQLDFSVTITGREIHTSMRSLALYPQPSALPQGSEVGVDAIGKLARILLLLEDSERQWALRRPPPVGGSDDCRQPSAVQDTGPLTINPTFVQGGSHVGMVPGHARVEGIISYPAWMEGSVIRREFERRIRSFCELDDWLTAHPVEVSVCSVYDWPPHLVDAGSAGPRTLGRSYREALGRAPAYSAGKFVGDAAFLQRDCNIDAVYFGPGDPSMGAHGPDEHVPVAQVLAAAKVFAQFIMEWCGRTGPSLGTKPR